ncbi:MAG TPA: sulfate ABC transporter permease subunit CysW [Candidatus Hydrogenedentes bacterium]|nr:sulfate ABC transporter permease subunit CysW [Candidatus Hydrogenedentota bacterium]HPC16454.1 sulfate ABC transporter permease subunit CysW [Candidatus Hydrogenedentota bacterium]HRT20165.1 sulfate ABC transporter permease subunit CysW [Candidatus Hydrogenedentota bacterium]HRT63199.1 sulfate ABC transporter permease subunit CysW [Candidatus Hydrogenedentota bacterium]
MNRSKGRRNGEKTGGVFIRWLLTGIALVFILIFLVAPLVAVFAYAFQKGVQAYWSAIADPDAWAAIRLTLLTAALVVPVNALFGIAAAWCIAKFDFWGKNILITLIDLPFTVSPVIAGAVFVFLLGANGFLGAWLESSQLKVIFAVPGIVIATLFVTFPLVARELIPLMQSLGNDDEEAALSLGASGWRTFFRITLPNIRWGLLYGIVLCTARAMGEFGAVSVVSGHIRGVTTTMPLHIEILYNEYNFVAAFAVASLLALLSLVTLAGKKAVEWASAQQPNSDAGWGE